MSEAAVGSQRESGRNDSVVDSNSFHSRVKVRVRVHTSETIV